MKPEDQELMDRYFQGRASDEEVAELEARMLTHPELRKQYLYEAMAESDLRSFALREDATSTYGSIKPETVPRFWKTVAPLAAAAAIGLIIAGVRVMHDEEPTVGRIASSEQAG